MITCHEAGHALAAVRLEIPFEFVYRGIGEDGGVELSVSPISDRDHDWSDDDLHQYQLFYVAGRAAERRLFANDRSYAVREDIRFHSELASRRGTLSGLAAFEADAKAGMELLDDES